MRYRQVARRGRRGPGIQRRAGVARANHVQLRRDGTLDARDATPSNLLALQRTAGNRAVQRLIDDATFAAETKLKFRKGKSHKAFAAMREALAAYKTMGNAPIKTRVDFLWKLQDTVETWLAARGGKSSRADAVKRLKQSIKDEIAALGNKLSEIQPDDFSGKNEKRVENEKYGGALSKLDEIDYDFGVENGMKVEGGSFTGLFKEGKDRDDAISNTRGPGSGVTADDPRIVERNLATQAIAQLLGTPELIPQTFKAKHNRGTGELEGIVMEKIKGTTGKDAPTTVKTDPVFRKCLSNLYLLDIICAQVDRHPGNYMVVMDGGKVTGVVGIDNDLSFGDKHDDLDWAKHYGFGDITKVGGYVRGMLSNGKLAHELTEIDAVFAQRIITLSQNTGLVQTALAAFLKPGEITACIGRIRALAQFLTPLMQQPNGVVKTKWE